MALLSRQQVAQNWHEADPAIHFTDLLDALELYKDIATEYGLNDTVDEGWKFGDPHKKDGTPDRHDYDIKSLRRQRGTTWPPNGEFCIDGW